MRRILRILNVVSAVFLLFQSPASGRQCICVTPRTRKPSAWPHSLRRPRSNERSFRYMAIALPSGQPEGNWLLWQSNIAERCLLRSAAEVLTKRVGFAVR